MRHHCHRDGAAVHTRLGHGPHPHLLQPALAAGWGAGWGVTRWAGVGGPGVGVGRGNWEHTIVEGSVSPVHRASRARGGGTMCAKYVWGCGGAPAPLRRPCTKPASLQRHKMAPRICLMRADAHTTSQLQRALSHGHMPLLACGAPSLCTARLCLPPFSGSRCTHSLQARPPGKGNAEQGPISRQARALRCHGNHAFLHLHSAIAPFPGPVERRIKLHPSTHPCRWGPPPRAA